MLCAHTPSVDVLMYLFRLITLWGFLRTSCAGDSSPRHLALSANVPFPPFLNGAY